jgi:putative oxidoreductase
MRQFLGKYADIFYSILRIVSGLLFLCHGTQKLFGFPGTNPPLPLFASLPAWGGVIEIICGTLITIGLLTPFAAFIASGEMAVAYFVRHIEHGFWPLLNRGELTILYCFLFLYFAAMGSGRFSIDAARRRQV